MTAAKIALGRRLFFDPILSRDGTLTCSGCHDPDRAFTDGRRVAVGVAGAEGTRNVPTLVNRAYGRSHFWDGRAAGLEEPALQPILNSKELGMTIADMVRDLRRHPEYPELFRTAFGRTPTSADLGNALAGYVRTILSGAAPVDRFLAGDADALSPWRRKGYGSSAARATAPPVTSARPSPTSVSTTPGWRGSRAKWATRAATA